MKGPLAKILQQFANHCDDHIALYKILSTTENYLPAISVSDLDLGSATASSSFFLLAVCSSFVSS